MKKTSLDERFTSFSLNPSTDTNSQKKLVKINQNIYDMVEFQFKHPGGKKIIQDIIGKDATQLFYYANHGKTHLQLLKKYMIHQFSDEKTKNAMQFKKFEMPPAISRHKLYKKELFPFNLSNMGKFFNKYDFVFTGTQSMDMEANFLWISCFANIFHYS